MILNNMIKGMLSAAIISLSVATSAFAVTCPAADDVKNTAEGLNAIIRPMDGIYIVFSAMPLVDANQMKWMVMTENKATSFDPAFDSGNASVSGVVANANTTAVEKGNTYLCAYLTTSGVMNVEAISPKDDGSGGSINPYKMDLHALMNTKIK